MTQKPPAKAAARQLQPGYCPQKSTRQVAKGHAAGSSRAPPSHFFSGALPLQMAGVGGFSNQGMLSRTMFCDKESTFHVHFVLKTAQRILYKEQLVFGACFFSSAVHLHCADFKVACKHSQHLFWRSAGKTSCGSMLLGAKLEQTELW